jgi:hypothetical protein
MRLSLIYILTVWLTATLFTISKAGANPGNQGLYLLTDRSWAISGDTVWFKVIAVNAAEERGNVVHVQLENLQNEPVSRIMVVTSDGKGEGFIPVPDSLSTGKYWLYAYTSAMRNSETVAAPAKLLTVYHRFDETFESVPMPDANSITHNNITIQDIDIQLSSTTVSPRGQVKVNLVFSNEMLSQLKDLVVSASLEESLSASVDQFYSRTLKSQSLDEIRTFPPEYNGFLIEGRVLPMAGSQLPPKSMVILAIPDSIPWFDYYLANDDGYFRFTLKNARGTADIFIRAIASENQELKVELEKGMITGSEHFSVNEQILSPSQAQWIKSITEAAWYEKVFLGEQTWTETYFAMDHPYSIPFYGKANRRVVLSEFIELPDFQEISRELLPGVRYRRRGNSTTLQLMDNGERMYFEKNPLRLINGIPIFDDGLLYRFKSSDIEYIDIINEERIFGDISFKGVLALSLTDRENNWIAGQKTLYSFSIPCLQVPQPPSYMTKYGLALPANLPDFRKVFLFERIDREQPKTTFQFSASDLKGSIVVKLQGITLNNEPFEITRKIEVQ